MSKITTLFLLLFLSLGVLAQVEYNMQDATVTDCSGILYDSGGPDGDYGPNEKFTFTICPDPVPTCIQIDFGTVIIEELFDYLEVFDGSDISSPQLFSHNDGTQTTPIFKAESGCMTVRFQSDSGTEESGWKANWNCFAENCPTTVNIPNEQDCEGAIPVCQPIHHNEKAYLGEGNLINEIDDSETCLESGEKNSVWYKLRAQADGKLAFSITPNDLEDDYDWLVFHLIQGSCVEAFSNFRLLLSCNYSTSTGVTGATGATNQTSAFGAGENQNATIPVKKGGVYAINISQYSTSPNGFSIDFSASTIPIEDNTTPSIGEKNDFLKGTNSDILQLNFVEDVQCQSIEAMNLQIKDYQLINENICNELGYASKFMYKIEPELELGFHDLKIAGEVTDACGNTQYWNESIEFQIADLTAIDPTLQSQIRLYPNPTTETIFVELPISTEKMLIEVYNIEGKLLQSLPILNQKTTAINVSNYPKGVYYLKVNVGNSHWTEKVVVR